MNVFTGALAILDGGHKYTAELALIVEILCRRPPLGKVMVDVDYVVVHKIYLVRRKYPASISSPTVGLNQYCLPPPGIPNHGAVVPALTSKGLMTSKTE